MPRAPYRPVEETEALRPVASPVDTFVTPQAPSRGTSLQDLARSLSCLGGNLGSFVEKRDKDAEEADRLRGKAAFWQSNGTGAAEGVSKGLIPAQASPQFMKGYKETEGEVAGGQLEQKFAAAYDTWEGKTSTDPKAYDQFISGFLKDNIQTKDPDVLRGLIPKVHQIASNYLQRHIGDASKATMQGYTTVLSARGDQAIQDANTTGLATRKGTDYVGVFGRLDAIREEGLKTGATREQLDEKLIDTITSNAVTQRDPKLLDFLDRKVPGQDYTWGNTPYGRDARQKTIDTLETMGRKSIADDEKKRREEKTEAKDTVTRETIQAITKAPNEPIPEDLLARGEKVDPDFRVNAIRWRDTIGKGTQTSDNGEMLAVTTDILNGGGLRRVQRAISDGVFKNPEDLTRAYKLAESMKEHGPAITAVFSSDQSKAIERTIRERTLTQNNLEAVMDPDGMSDTGLAAKRDYRLALLTWRQANPDADFIAQEKAIGEIGASILKRITLSDTGGGTYSREGLPEDNPFVRAPTPEAPTVAGSKVTPKPNPFGGRDAPQAPGAPQAGTVSPPGPQAPAPAVPAAPRTQATPEQAGAWFNGLPAETRGAIEMKAAQEKKPLTLKMQELYARGVERGIIAPPAAPAPTGATGKRSDLRAPDGTPIETASATVGPTEAVDFQKAFAGAFAGKATFDGTTATLNNRTFSQPTSAEAVARQFTGLDENDPQGRAVLTAFLSKSAGKTIDPAKIPWCAAFVDSVLDASGHATRGSLMAKDFLDYGTAVDNPTRGDVVVFKSLARGSSGHVGFVVGIEGDHVRYFAGNDNGKAQESTLPLDKVAGFRRPPEAGGATLGGQTAQNIQEAFKEALANAGAPQGNYASADLKADPRAARILDFVAGPESKGNYNAFFGNADSTKDLSGMTLDQVMAWSGDRGTKSSATGRYQFMRETLAGLKTELGLTGTERFTPALQDRLALSLLERRGYRDFAAGKITPDQFANNLAKEWAALPNMQTGRSQYAGDGLNKSLVTPDAVRNALTGSGAFPGAALKEAAKTVTAATISKAGGLTDRLRGMFGGGSPKPAPDAYANAPDAPTQARLRASNPDPVGNSEQVLGTLAPVLAAAIRKAQADNPKLRIVVASRSGEGAEVWPVDANGRVSFEPGHQDAVAAAIRRSAVQLGAGVNVGGGTGGGRTHFELAATTPV